MKRVNTIRRFPIGVRDLLLLLLAILLFSNVWAAPKVEFKPLESPDEAPEGTPLSSAQSESNTEGEESFLGKTGDVLKSWAKETFDGEVFYQPGAKEASVFGKYGENNSRAFLPTLLRYYQRSQIDEEGLSDLSQAGSDVEKQIEFYQRNPERLQWDVFRRIQHARTHSRKLESLEDVFRLQNAFRSRGADPLEKLIFRGGWLNRVREPLGSNVPFPIHVVTLHSDQSATLGFGGAVALAPTAIRWPHEVPANAALRVPAGEVVDQHRDCRRITTGQLAGRYHHMRFSGPHSVGHPDVVWWESLFAPTALKPRRVAVLVSVNATMKEADPRSETGTRSCQRYQNVMSLIQGRWEGLEYALVPFSQGVLGVAPDKVVPFYTWKGHSREISRELNQWACAVQALPGQSTWNQATLVRDLQKSVFQGTYRYGDSAIVILDAKDPHYQEWVHLSEASGGTQSYASASGLLAALDISVRAIPRR